MAFNIFTSFLVIAVVGQSLAQEITSTGCGLSKGCFRQPAGCKTSSDCDFMVTYQADKTNVNFEVSAKATKWVALGVNTVPKMKGSTGEICIVSANQVHGANGPVLKGFKNGGYAPPTLYSQAGNTNLDSLKNVNGALICRFTRSIQQDATYQEILNKDYHFVVAGGNQLSSTGGPQYHSSRFATSLKYNAAIMFNPATAAPVTTKPVVPGTSNTTSSNTSTSASTTTMLLPSPTSSFSMASHVATPMPSVEPSASSKSVATPSAEPTASSKSAATPSTEPTASSKSVATPSAEPTASSKSATPSAEPVVSSVRSMTISPSATVKTPAPSVGPKHNAATVAGPTIIAIVSCLLMSKWFTQ